MITEDRDVETGFAAIGGGEELAYEIRGLRNSGLPLLLVRPLGGSMALWGPFRDALASERRVITFDLPGLGRSKGASARTSTTALARDSLALLDHLGVERAHVFGISLGGMVATWIAILAPSRVAALCIASAPARGLRLSRAALRRAVETGVCFLRSGDAVEVIMVRQILSTPFRSSQPERALAVLDEVRRHPAPRVAVLKYLLAGARHDARRHLRDIVAPTLVLTGACDNLLPRAAVDALTSGLPVARSEVIADAGHALTVEQPLATAALVAQFVQNC